METRITKIEKGCFAVEYKESKWGDWKMLDKTFKTLPKAQEYVNKIREMKI